MRPSSSAVSTEPGSAPRRRYLKPMLVTLAIVAVIGSFAAYRATQASKDGGKGKKPDAPVTLQFTPADIVVVEIRELERSIAFSGSLSPLVQTTVRSKVPGELNRVLVREGEAVAAGQLLAQIDTADLQSRLDARTAALEEAKARLDIAEKNLANNLKLLRQKFISQIAFDTAQSTHEASQAAVRSEEAQVMIARRAMEDAAVRAPFAGIIARRMANRGEKVGVDSPLFALVDLGRMEIEAPVPASEVPAIRAGQPVSFRVDGFGDRPFEGRVERINPTADSGSRSIIVYISVANRDGVLKGGMFAKGRIVLDTSSPATAIPADAVREESGQTFVYTIEGGKIARRPVTLGVTETRRGLVEVTQGLEKGLTVISARVSGLKPGAPAILKTGEAAPGKAG